MNDILGKSIVVSFTTSGSTPSVFLVPGRYNITCDQDCYVETGPTAAVAATSTSFPLWAKGYVIDVNVAGYVAARGITQSGSLWIKAGGK